MTGSHRRPDVFIKPGLAGKPAVVFIHGLGMNKWLWVSPARARILGGLFPLSVLLAEPPQDISSGAGATPPLPRPRITVGSRPKKLRTVFHDLAEKGYPVIAWSQKRPAGTVDVAAEELAGIVDQAAGLSGSGIILIGHSRGGLIARQHLAAGDRRIRGLITLCAPHSGSSLSRLAAPLAPLASAFSPLLRNAGDASLIRASVSRVVEFLGSPALRELLPGERFDSIFSAQRAGDLLGLSIGGTSPSLFTLYRWKRQAQGEGVWRVYPERLLSLPEMLEAIVPRQLYPDELRDGLGDGLVTARSARLPWGDLHRDFPLNHAQILFHREVREFICTWVDALSRREG